MTSVDGAASRFAWDAGLVPEIVTVVILPFDASTGEAIRPRKMQWSDADVDGIGINWRQDLFADYTTGEYRFGAPVGFIELSVQDPRYFLPEPVLELVSSRNEIRIELERPVVAVLSFQQNGATVTVPLEYWWELRTRTPDGLPHTVDLLTTTRASTRYFDLPGVYTFEFPDLDGYEPIPPREVFLAEAQATEVTIELKRRN